MNSLTVLYDEHCVLCRRCRDWLLTQATYLPLDLLAAGTPAARRQFGGMPWYGKELIVVSDEGEAWVGPAAFILCLWATKKYRPWSYRLASPTFAPLAERFFSIVSSRRDRLGAILGSDECTWCEQQAASTS